MAIPRDYARALRKNLRAQAAWPPIQALQPGDYGEFEGGIFSRIGNLTTDFGVPCEVESGGHRAERFEYHSERESSLNAGLRGGAGGAEAGLELELSRASSFYVSVADCDLVRLKSPRSVAMRLREAEGWRYLRYYVVWELFRGHDLVFYGSEAGGSRVQIRGSTADVKLFQATGKVGGSLGFAASSAALVKFRGAAGEEANFAVNVFRVKRVGDALDMDFEEDRSPLELLEDYGDEPPGAS